MKETIELTWYSATKGYGFAVSAEEKRAGQDIFVHYSAFLNRQNGFTANKGQRFRADVVTGPKGPQALNLEEVQS